MKPEVRALFTKDVIDQACARFDVHPAALQPLEGFESLVFAATQRGARCVLKISHSDRMSVAYTRGEVAFVTALHRQGVGVAMFLESNRGQMVEELAMPAGIFTATLQMFAPGVPAGPDVWGPAMWTAMGTLAGKMHVVSQGLDPIPARPDVLEHQVPILREHLPRDQPKVRERAEQLIATIENLHVDTHAIPTPRGLIHGDFHRGNFHVDNGELTLFDFDDCMVSWYVHDLAIALFYAVPNTNNWAEDRARGQAFVDHFCTGYTRHAELPDHWMARVRHFLALRELVVYAVIHRSLAPSNYDPWCRNFIHNRRERIEAGVPWLDLAFA